MDETLPPEDALLPRVPPERLDAWLPPGDLVLIERRSSKHNRHKPMREGWARDFVLSRLRADGAWNCQAIPHADGFEIVSYTRDGSRLYVQAQNPEARRG